MWRQNQVADLEKAKKKKGKKHLLMPEITVIIACIWNLYCDPGSLIN